MMSEELLTKNTTFTGLSAKLQQMGVENYNFMLTQYDSDIVSAAHNMSEDIDFELYARLIEICKNDIWFFLREMLAVPGLIFGEYDFKLNEANMAAIFCLEKGNSVYLNSPRETYKTVSLLSYMMYKMIFHRNDYDNYNIIVRNEDVGKELKCSLKNIIRMTFGKQSLQLNSVIDAINIYIIKNPDDIKSKLSSGNNLNFIPDAEFQRLDILKDLPGVNMFEGVIGLHDNYPHIFEMLKNSHTFENTMYDISEIFDGLVYIKKHFYELGLDMDWYMDMCKMFDYNENIIRREIMLDRI